jgi:hypothetical protein
VAYVLYVAISRTAAKTLQKSVTFCGHWRDTAQNFIT